MIDQRKPLESDEPQPSLNLPPCTDWRLVKGTVRNPYAPRSRGWTVEIRDHDGVVQDCLEFGANTQEPGAVARAAANARLAAAAPAMLELLMHVRDDVLSFSDFYAVGHALADIEDRVGELIDRVQGEKFKSNPGE